MSSSMTHAAVLSCRLGTYFLQCTLSSCADLMENLYDIHLLSGAKSTKPLCKDMLK